MFSRSDQEAPACETRHCLRVVCLFLALASSTCLWSLTLLAGEPDDVRTHAEQSFGQLKQPPQSTEAVKSVISGVIEGKGAAYSSDQYWVGTGQGDLAKGRSVCQRVSELSARTDLAKQIRVMVKEHMVDRVRERSGRASEQDIELTREEIVQEYLMGVTIVDRHIDEENMICTATAIMPKPKQAFDADPSTRSSR